MKPSLTHGSRDKRDRDESLENDALRSEGPLWDAIEALREDFPEERADPTDVDAASFDNGWMEAIDAVLSLRDREPPMSADTVTNPDPTERARPSIDDVMDWLHRMDGRLGDIFGLWVQGKRDDRWVAEKLVSEGHIAALSSEAADEPDAVNGGRCAAQAQTALHGWVQCVKPPFHEDRHVWGDDNQITEAEPFA